MSITLLDSAGSEVTKQTHQILSQIADYQETEPALVRFVFVLEPGDYHAQVTLLDHKTKNSRTFTRRVRLPNYGNSELSFSDLEFASSITVSQDTTSVLVKNFRKIVPNVARVYGREVNTLYVYFEIYNIVWLPGTQDKWLDMRCTILEDSVAVKSEKIRYPLLGRSLAGDLGIRVDDLGPGRFRLLLKAMAPDGQVAQKETVFNIIKPYQLYSHGEMEEFMRQIAVIAAPDEIEHLKSDDDTLRAIDQFWKSRDPTPNTEHNEMFLEFCRKVLYANEHFTCHGQPGWETERGRIYIINGQPNRTEQDENGREMWTYSFAQYVFPPCEWIPN
ncbi:MAG: GWxTD domain-containing protein [bacterium]